ncbi:hypothetical protein CRYUN_Cryun13aG0130200 [Craigia yunnanensis]
MSHLDNIPSTPGKHKPDKSFRFHSSAASSSLSKLTLYSTIFLSLLLILLLLLLLLLLPFLHPIPTPVPLHWDPPHPNLSSPQTNPQIGPSSLNHRPHRPCDWRCWLRRNSRDINNKGLLQQLFDAVLFTHVMHLAAQAGVRYAMQNPGSYIHSNIAGFVNLLEVSKSANPQPAIIWASSSSVYGLNSEVPFSEKDRTDQPASLYAATKKAGEEIAHTYNHIYGLSITGLRFFTVYGPWDNGSVARDFTYIDDIVKGCLGALDTAKKSTGSGGKKRGPAQLRIFNLGNTSPVPVSRLVSILEKILKVKAKKKVVPLPRNGDVEFTHANITLAVRELGYKPTTDLEAGLKKFVRWYLSFYLGSKKKSSW